MDGGAFPPESQVRECNAGEVRPEEKSNIHSPLHSTTRPRPVQCPKKDIRDSLLYTKAPKNSPHAVVRSTPKVAQGPGNRKSRADPTEKTCNLVIIL